MWTPSRSPTSPIASPGDDAIFAALRHAAIDASAGFADHEPEPVSRTRGADWSLDGSYGLRTQNDASLFWQRLTTGAYVLVETLSDTARCAAVACERFSVSSALSDRELVLLHRAFQAEQQKNMAFGFEVSMSTVSQVLGGALVKLGLTRRVRSTPLAIVLAALSHCGVIELPAARSACFQAGNERYIALSLPSLNMDLLGDLTAAEREVAFLLASSGASTAHIATLRRTSASTVSNQIAALCAKLRVHGRFELILRWAELQWGLSAAAE
jgi:DNA-binding CsgD family transcriptional regulator